MIPYPPPSPEVERLLRHPKFGSGIGFQRTFHLFDSLPVSSWWSGLDALKVTGSKGKGSTARFASEILRHLGLRTGLYTSPHLFRFHERIRIQGAEVDDRTLLDACSWLDATSRAYRAAHPHDTFAAFETFTAVALHCFQHANVEALVAEAGIGGRYDTTRALPGSTVALTSVELEHTDLLGSQPELIAYDKSDLCPAGGTLVLGPVDPEVRRRLAAYARVRELRLIEVTTHAAVDHLHFADWRMSFSLRCGDLDFGRLETSLLGEHQAWNIAVATLAVRDWLQRRRPDLDPSALRDAVVEAARTVAWPGRLERLSREPDVIIDVGHTAQSMRAIANTLRRMNDPRPVLLVTGVSYNKDVDGVLRELLPVAQHAICTAAHYKGSPAGDIERRAHALRPELGTTCVEPLEHAVKAAVDRAAREGSRVLVAGGLFLAIEAMATLQGYDPRSLRFA